MIGNNNRQETRQRLKNRFLLLHKR